MQENELPKQKRVYIDQLLPTDRVEEHLGIEESMRLNLNQITLTALHFFVEMGEKVYLRGGFLESAAELIDPKLNDEVGGEIMEMSGGNLLYTLGEVNLPVLPPSDLYPTSSYRKGICIDFLVEGAKDIVSMAEKFVETLQGCTPSNLEVPLPSSFRKNSKDIPNAFESKVKIESVITTVKEQPHLPQLLQISLGQAVPGVDPSTGKDGKIAISSNNSPVSAATFMLGNNPLDPFHARNNGSCATFDSSKALVKMGINGRLFFDIPEFPRDLEFPDEMFEFYEKQVSILLTPDSYSESEIENARIASTNFVEVLSRAIRKTIAYDLDTSAIDNERIKNLLFCIHLLTDLSSNNEFISKVETDLTAGILYAERNGSDKKNSAIELMKAWELDRLFMVTDKELAKPGIFFRRVVFNDNKRLLGVLVEAFNY